MKELIEIAYKKHIIKKNNRIIKLIIEENKKEEKTVEALKKEVSQLLIDIMKIEETK